ncbi:glutamate racemase, partial [Streptomyces sp. NPDC054841]
GCTHYELVAERIRAAVSAGRSDALPPVVLHGSAGAVAAQALRRIDAGPAPEATPSSLLTVLLSGRESQLPERALGYAEGRLLGAVQPVTPAH